MKAGTLEIEIVAEIARLQEDMRKVQKSVGDMSAGVTRGTKAVNDNFRGMARTGKLAGHQMQNLSYQLNDVVVSLASGQKPMTVFMQQGSQIGQIMAGAGVGIGGLVTQIGGMVGGFMAAHPVLTALAAAAGIAAGAIGLITSEINKNAAVQVTWTDTLLGAWDMARDYLTGTLTSAFEAFGLSTASVWADVMAATKTAVNFMIGAASLVPRALVTAFKVIPSAVGDVFYSTVNAMVGALNSMVERAVAAINGMLSAVNPILEKVGMGLGTLEAPQIATLENNYAGAAAAAAAAFGQTFTDTWRKDYIGDFADGLSEAAQNRARMRKAAEDADAKKKGAGGSADRAKAAGVDELAKAYERAVKQALSFIAALDQETTRIGKTAIQIKQMEVAAAAAAAPTAELAQNIRDAGAAWEAATRAQADADYQKNVIKPLQDELALLGLVGPARELAALALEETAFKAKLAADGVTDVNKAWEEYLRLRTDIINGESALEKEAAAAEMLTQQVNQLIGALGGMGGMGQALGGLLGLFTGNISAIGGPLGDLLNMPTAGTKTDASGRQVARTIGDELRGIFKMEGEFGKTMTSLLGGASTGMMAAGAFGFGKSSGSQIGSAIGGTLGKEFGKQVLGKALGLFAGPVGSIVGGLLGGLLGGVFKKVKWGSATIGGVDGALGITGTRGNSSSRTAAATKSANAVIDSLEGLAEELNAGIDVSRGSVSLGVRKKSYRVDPTGQGITRKDRGAISFGQDAEAAAEFAMLDLIKDGVLTGLRKGTEMLLKGGDDLQAAVKKALKFENVFKELAQRTTPLEFALSELTLEFDRLRKIFDEAGASAADYAALEQLLALRRQEAVENIGRQAIDDLADQNSLQVEMLRLLGREQDAIALARIHELAATKATLQPLTAMVYQLRDARDVIEQFQPLADGLKAFKQELLGGTAGAGGFAATAAQFRATAGAARMGDATALGKLQGDASAFLDAARDNARSDLEFRRALGEVLAATDQGIFAAEAQIDYAQLQIDAINNTATILTDIKAEMATYQARIVEQGEWVERMFRRWEGEGIPIRSDATNPIFTEVAP